MVRGILERLDAGEVIIGDGGFVFNLERRGYVTAGSWTPEAVVEHTEAVRQLHREYLRAGADVMQTMTFYASDDKLNFRGNPVGSKMTCTAINNAACELAREVADEGAALVAGGITKTPSYAEGLGKDRCQKEFRAQTDIFVAHGVDFLIGELAAERGRYPKASEKHDLEGLRLHAKAWVRARANRSYWESLKQPSGRPDCPSMCQPITDDSYKPDLMKEEHKGSQ